MLYRVDDDVTTITDVISPTAVQEICKLERVVLDHPAYDDFCMKVCPAESCGCAPQAMSVAYLLYNAAANSSAYDQCTLLTEAQISNKIDAIKTAVNMANPPNAMRPLIQYYSFFLPREFKETGVMNATRR
jgi:hypothetical protein